MQLLPVPIVALLAEVGALVASVPVVLRTAEVDALVALEPIADSGFRYATRPVFSLLHLLL